jgi:hypothetical protein
MCVGVHIATVAEKTPSFTILVKGNKNSLKILENE